MNVETWQLARGLFKQALERDPATWDHFLEEVCQGQPELREEMRTLLASYKEADGFLEEPVTALGPEDPFEGRQVGAYRLTRCLERGGMGRVYLAVRSDDEFQKRVAVKILRRGVFSEDFVRRFHNERQILAALDHSNIARLFDGGTTEEGLPYLVMEYVEGKPIDEYHELHGLSVTDSLELFVKACSAVQFAHQNLVVHCDLKPANILVTEGGKPMLLDFGIAKLLNPELTGRTLVPTALARPMTPEYASPEQVIGEPITTAADIYSLGVLLYYLLTGCHPYRLQSFSPLEIARVISTEVPPAPSLTVKRRGGPKQLQRLLAGDLDKIVLKALRKDPRQRYVSVEQFSDDLRRYLQGRPVLARKATLTYRCSKFIHRHRVGVTAVAVFIVSILVFGAVMAIQRDEIARERDRAKVVKGFLVDIFEVSDPIQSNGETITAREILEKGARRLDLELGKEPEIQAEMQDTIGQIFLRMGLVKRAGPLLESALKTRHKVLGGAHVDVSESLGHLAELRMEKGDYDSAEELFRESLTIRRRLLSGESIEVAESLNDLGKLFQFSGRLKAAEESYREALTLRIQLFGRSHVEVAETLNNLANVLADQDDVVAAESLHREALDIRRELFGEVHVEVSESYNNLAALLHKQGKFKQAQAYFEQALELRITMLGEGHHRVGTVYNNLAELLRDQGDYAASEPYFKKALEIYRGALGATHPYVVAALINLSQLKKEQGGLEQAKAFLEEAVSTSREADNLHQYFGRALIQLAGLLEGQGDYAAAQPLFEEALEVYRRTLGDRNLNVAAALMNLARLSEAEGVFENARIFLEEAVLIARQAEGRRHYLGLALAQLAGLLTEQGLLDDAEPHADEAVNILKETLPAGHWAVAAAETVVAGCLVGRKQFEAAEELLKRAVPILRNSDSRTAAFRLRRAAAYLVEISASV